MPINGVMIIVAKVSHICEIIGLPIEAEIADPISPSTIAGMNARIVTINPVPKVIHHLFETKDQLLVKDSTTPLFSITMEHIAKFQRTSRNSNNGIRTIRNESNIGMISKASSNIASPRSRPVHGRA